MIKFKIVIMRLPRGLRPFAMTPFCHCESAESSRSNLTLASFVIASLPKADEAILH